MEDDLQDDLLEEISGQGSEVTVFLTNGYQLTGEIAGFDNFTIIMREDEREKMIYKHAISTIVPREFDQDE